MLKLPFVRSSSIGIPIWAVGTGGPIRVLLIDDDKDEESLTRSLLARVEDIKYELDWVPTYSEGLASIARGEHDAYLVDHQLGARTGIELVAEARQAGSLAALIILTGHRDRATDLAAMEAGATDFLLKSRTDAALLDRTLRYSISHVAMVSSLDRSRNQMACLEEIGRILVQDGPTLATVERVVDLIVDRFALPQMAIYLADGDTLYPAGERGYEHPLPSLSRGDASVDRIAHAKHPLFVPSLSSAAGGRNAGGTVATELSVPLLVEGELMGLLNVASSVAAPIGEQDFSAIGLVADRLTAALAVTRERRVMRERLAMARQELFIGEQPSGQQAVIDSQTSAYRRPLLEPLLEVAIASAVPQPNQNLRVLLVACEQTGPDAVTRLADQARIIFAHRALVRFAETELAVLVGATDEASVRSEAGDLLALAGAIGLVAWCGYAALRPEGGANEVVAAAQTALAFAQRVGPGTVIGYELDWAPTFGAGLASSAAGGNDA